MVKTFSSPGLCSPSSILTGPPHHSPSPSQAQHSSIIFSYDHLELPPRLSVSIDPIKVAQAFRNLVNNAFENTPAGGSITVRILRVCRENNVSLPSLLPSFTLSLS
jgi:hypothetical protein